MMLQGYEKLCYLIGKVNVDKLKKIVDENGRIYIPYTTNRSRLNMYLSEEMIEILVENHAGEKITIVSTKNKKLEQIIRVCLDAGISKRDMHSCLRASYKEIDVGIKKVLGLAPHL